MRRRSRGMTTGVLAVWALLCAPAIGLDAQQATTPAQTAPAQAPPAPSAQEKQAPPTVDSDPVPSPDPDTRTPVPAPSSKGPTKSGEITKENGHYTLRANAYWARLHGSRTDCSRHARCDQHL